MRPLRYAAALLLPLGLAACSSDAEPSTSPTTSPTTNPPSTAHASTDPTDPTDASDPATPTPTPALLDWRPVPGPASDSVTTNGPWTLTVSDAGASWDLTGPHSGSGSSTQGWRVSDALLDDDWAVVVLQDRTEQRPAQATVTDLGNGKTFTLDGRSDVPTTNGGTWALGDDRLLHATLRRGSYCLAEVDLETRTSRVAWCAPKRTGFNAAHVSDAGDSLLWFDDSRPSCRTVVAIDDGEATPFPGVEKCKGWEGLLTDDGAVWSVIPRERRIEEAHFYARVGDRQVDLGPGVAGSLVECGDAAYFARDPQQQGQPATLLRWSADDGLTIAYESPKGQAFIEAPRCGGDAITVTALTSAGDEQVTAAVD